MSDESETAKQDAIQHHQEVLATHRKRLALLTQYDQLGIQTPPHIIIDIRDTQEALRPIKAWLRTKDIPIADEPNDDVQIAEATPLIQNQQPQD